MAVAGFVLGILGIVFTGSIVFSLIGLPLSVFGLKKLRLENKPTGIGTAGFVLNITGLCLSVILGLIFFILITIGVLEPL
jgi:hypothetical protein